MRRGARVKPGSLAEVAEACTIGNRGSKSVNRGRAPVHGGGERGLRRGLDRRPRGSRLVLPSPRVKLVQRVRPQTLQVSKPTAALWALLLLLAQLGGAWHLARQDHVRCAEHGEWIDAPARSIACTASPSSRGPHIDGAPPTSGPHDHCAILLASRQRVAPSATSFGLSFRSQVLVRASVPRLDPIETGFAIFLLAPKHSPPCC